MANAGLEKVPLNVFCRYLMVCGIKRVENWMYGELRKDFTKFNNWVKENINPKGRPSKAYVLGKMYNPSDLSSVDVDN